MTFDEQKRRIADLEAMIDVAVGYIKSGQPGLASIVLIGSRSDYLRPLEISVDPRDETVDGPTSAEADEILGKRHYSEH